MTNIERRILKLEEAILIRNNDIKIPISKKIKYTYLEWENSYPYRVVAKEPVNPGFYSGFYLDDNYGLGIAGGSGLAKTLAKFETKEEAQEYVDELVDQGIALSRKERKELQDEWNDLNEKDHLDSKESGLGSGKYLSQKYSVGELVLLIKSNPIFKKLNSEYSLDFFKHRGSNFYTRYAQDEKYEEGLPVELTLVTPDIYGGYYFTSWATGMNISNPDHCLLVSKGTEKRVIKIPGTTIRTEKDIVKVLKIIKIELDKLKNNSKSSKSLVAIKTQGLKNIIKTLNKLDYDVYWDSTEEEQQEIDNQDSDERCNTLSDLLDMPVLLAVTARFDDFEYQDEEGYIYSFDIGERGYFGEAYKFTSISQAENIIKNINSGYLTISDR